MLDREIARIQTTRVIYYAGKIISTHAVAARNTSVSAKNLSAKFVKISRNSNYERQYKLNNRPVGWLAELS